MRAPDARNTATLVGAAAAALIAVSPLLGAPASGDGPTLGRHDRRALSADANQPGRMDLGGAGAGRSAFVRGHRSQSKDGRTVAFSSWAFDLVPNDSNCMSDVFVQDRASGRTELVSVASDGGPANGLSWAAQIGPNGDYVNFSSTATNLVAGDRDGVADRFRTDLGTGITRLLHPLATSRPPARTIPFTTTPAPLVTP